MTEGPGRGEVADHLRPPTDPGRTRLRMGASTTPRSPGGGPAESHTPPVGRAVPGSRTLDRGWQVSNAS